MRIVERPEIEGALAGLDVLPLIEEGFVAYSEGRAVVPPVGELILEEGETHIKYGFIRGDPWYVVKIASGFCGNPERGLPSGDGMMLLFSQTTGRPVAMLLDHGHLTDVRTAAAGAIGARYLAPARVERIGVAGTGVQARLQVRHLKPVTPCRAVLAWGRHPERRDAYRRDMAAQGFEVEVTADPAELGATCNLIVTTTPASEPFLRRDDIRPGTHINAIGSDAPHKQELDPGILARADLVVADSRSQCRSRGEIARALDAGAIAPERVSELGEVIAGRASRRTAEDQITVFDSTGVAVQDIQIASAIARAVGVTPRSNP
jgi:ornithine cyclodeaminase